MRRPREITLENVDAIYDWQEQHESSSALLRLTHLASDLALRTTYDFLPGSRTATEEYAATGKGMVIALSHAETIDPGHYAKVIRREKHLRYIIGKVIVPAGMGWSSKPVLGWFLMNAGTLTACRVKEVYGADIPEEERPPEIEKARKAAGRRLIQIMTK